MDAEGQRQHGVAYQVDVEEGQQHRGLAQQVDLEGQQYLGVVDRVVVVAVVAEGQYLGLVPQVEEVEEAEVVEE